MTDNYLSKNLNWLLKQHDLSMAELSRRCNVPGPVVFRIVSGQTENPQVNTLIPIASYFNCSLDNLLICDLKKDPEKLNIKKEVTEIRHQMRNSIAVLGTVLQGVEKVFPALLESYYLLPKEMRPKDISKDFLNMLPKLIENGILTVSELKYSINKLKEKANAN